ncbi:carboxypeptidase regulatory-like domain-containing protein [Bacteroidales bacterium OttesenSCG-928-I14]|nr:carboxypeptidase regulatory-like domain-containing protein [Bacteroidales bacterium OttesenSCG-928-I14]
MKKRALNIFVLFTLMAISLFTIKAQDATFRGYNNYASGGITFGAVSFSSAEDLTFLSSSTELVSAGEYINNVWYAYTYQTVGYGKSAKNFATIDIETGVFTTIAPADKIVLDMTYDATTTTAYALSGSSAIYTVNLDNGALTHKYDLSGGTYSYWSIAINSDGEMYAIGSDCKLYKVDKNTGAVTLIGATGQTSVYSTYYQSMSFDPISGILYWAASNGNVCSIDKSTGVSTTLYSLGSHRITSLIPMISAEAGTPNKVNNLNATPGANGALSLKLTWDNPSTTVDGATLTSLTAIKIYRNDSDEAIHTINSPVIGKENNEWSDTNITSPGKYTYSIVGVNEIGEGVKIKVSAFVGSDLPKAVTELVVNTDGDNPVLTWTAPTEGANGGWFDSSTLKYKVLRNPGSVLVQENITATTFTDMTTNSLDLGYYSYTVVAYNNSGDGEAATTNEVLMGGALNVPWLEDFSTSSYLLWTKINANNDSYSWNKYTSSQHYEISSSYSGSNDDWLISPPIALEAGKQYQLKWTNRTSTNNSATYSVTIGSDKTVDGQSTILFPETTVLFGSKSAQSLLLTVPTTGTYYLGWHCTTPMAKGSLYIDDISLDEPTAVDMVAMRVSGNIAPMINTATTNKITVKNFGSSPASSFKVKLIDNGDNQLGTADYSGPALNYGEEADIEVSWTPTVSGTFAIRGVVEIANDADSSNDTTPIYNALVQPEGVESFEVVDDEATMPWEMLPFNLGISGTASQVVYTAAELGGEEMWISGIVYYYEAIELDYITSVKILLANTKKDSYDSFLLEADMTSVVTNTSITFKTGETSIFIPFNKPFLYTGDNLVVTSVRASSTNTKEIKFMASAPEDSEIERSIYYSGTAMFNFTQEGMPTTAYPNTTFLAYTNGDCSIKGKIVDQNSEALPGVSVKIDNVEVATTDENGEYEITNTPPFGSISVSSILFGYSDGYSSITVNAKETTVNLTMRALEKIGVMGKVKNSAGEYIEGAVVKLSDYGDYEAITNVEGTYYFENVYNSKYYTQTISKLGYEVFKTQRTIYGYGGVATLSDITLTSIDSVKVSGVVKNEEGLPFEGAKVKLTGFAGAEVTLEVTTNSDGTFEIENVYAGREYTMTVSADGYLDNESTITVGNVDYALEEDILMELIPVKVTVSGKVKSSKGTYLAGANITLSEGDNLYETTTDSEGVFNIEDVLESKEYIIKVSAANFYDYESTVSVSKEDVYLAEIELQAIPVKVTVSGKVISSAGGAVSGASIKLSEGEIVHELTSNSDGSFSIVNVLENKTYTLAISAVGYEDYTSTVTVVESDITLEDITLQLIPTTVTVTGKVKSNKGVYLANANIKLSEGSTVYETTTDASGVFTLKDVLMDKTYDIEITSSGYRPYNSTLNVAKEDVNMGDIVINEDVAIDFVDASQIKMYPNPASEYVIVELDSRATITIYELSGKIVYSNHFEGGNAQINLYGMKDGIYLVEIDKGLEGKTTKRLVISK